jgi:hypothetical protein
VCSVVVHVATYVCMYIIVSKYSAAVGMYTVTCLTAWNITNIKNICLVSRKSLE